MANCESVPTVGGTMDRYLGEEPKSMADEQNKDDTSQGGKIQSDEEFQASDADVKPKHAAETGKFRLNGKYAYVTWYKSKIDSKEEFHQKLLTILPAGVQLFGGRELHADGTPHYYVVISFREKVHWTNAVKKVSIHGDTNAIICIQKPKPRQRVSDFLENAMACCAKGGDTFGERLPLRLSAAEQKKRKWQDIIDEPDPVVAWRLVHDNFPREYMFNHPAIDKAMGKKQKTSLTISKRVSNGRFHVMELMDWWLDKYVVRRVWRGRPRSLIVVGDPMTGKSRWAESQGNPIVMNSGWCLKSVFVGATHLVVSDVKPAAFGYAGKSHWRDVLGGQDSFNCRDFQQETRTLPWGLPCIWTCNLDNDPRKDRAVADYIRQAGIYVVEIRDRVGERSWGKLYEPGAMDVMDDEEAPATALAQANEYVSKSYVDEALDLGLDYGI